MPSLSKTNSFLRAYGFTLGLTMFTSLVISSVFTTIQSKQFLRWVNHTHQVIETLSSISAMIEQAETNQRGYLFRHDPKLLAFYEGAKVKVPEQMAKLRNLVGDNELQTSRALELAAMIEGRLVKMDSVVNLDSKKSLAQISAKLDYETTSKIREFITMMQAEESRLLKLRESSFDRTDRASSVLTWAVGVLAILFMFLSRRLVTSSAKENLNQSLLLTSVFDTMTDGLVIVDRAATVTHFNAAAEALVGISLKATGAEERINRAAIYRINTDEPLRAEDAPSFHALKGENVNNFEVVTRRADQESKILSMEARPLRDAENRIHGALTLIRDVTVRKATEKQWEEAKNAAIEASRLKSDFLAAMSHEIRTPMNGVLGMTTLLQDTRLNSEQQGFVQTIKTSAEALLGLINQILDHAKIEEGKLELVQADFNLHECLQSVVSMFTYLARSKAVTLELILDPTVPEYVSGDAARLRQVLINLVGNALKFTDSGYVHLFVVPAVCSNSIHKILFTVKDTGPGIPKDKLSYLFERFSQVHTKSVAGGSGLGLMISRELVRLMSGEIGVQSVENFGSQFWFSAEFGLAERVVHAPLSLVHKRKKYQGHVLVAEDQPVNQKVIKKYLELFGLTSEIAANGQLAFEAYARGKFDLVLMDCQMPVLDGYQATTKIRELENANGTFTPIVALTAEGRSGDRKRCFEVGMNEFLTKPIEIERLETMLNKIFAGAVDEEAFDLDAVKRLMDYDSDGQPLAYALIEEYLLSTPKIIQAMEAAAKLQNFQELKDHAHSLRSSSLTLGLKRLGLLCEDLERNLSSSEQVVPIREAWTDGCAWLKDILRSRHTHAA